MNIVILRTNVSLLELENLDFFVIRLISLHKKLLYNKLMNLHY